MGWGNWFQERFPSSTNMSISRSLHTSTSTSLQFTSTCWDSKKPASEVTPSNQPPNTSARPESRLPGAPKGIPTALDKIFLVRSGVYKSKDQIPKQLEGDVIHRARSWGRIRINIGFLFIAAAGGALMVFLGKRAEARGESMQQQNLDWHRRVKEEYEAEQRNKK